MAASSDLSTGVYYDRYYDSGSSSEAVSSEEVGISDSRTKMVVTETYFDLLPPELFSNIFRYVSANDLVSCMKTHLPGGFAAEALCELKGRVANCLHSPGRGTVCYGQPEAGKTTFAFHVGRSLGCTEFNGRLKIFDAELLASKYRDVGVNVEKTIQKLFKEAKHESCKYGPKYERLYTVIIKNLGYGYSVYRNPLLAELDSLVYYRNILVIGMTNCLEGLDPALLRESRFGLHIKFD